MTKQHAPGGVEVADQIAVERSVEPSTRCIAPAIDVLSGGTTSATEQTDQSKGRRTDRQTDRDIRRHIHHTTFTTTQGVTVM